MSEPVLQGFYKVMSSWRSSWRSTASIGGKELRKGMFLTNLASLGVKFDVE